MRSSRASLFLMELMISILFFSLSSAVCIQLFVKAHAINEATKDISKATLIAQDICEYFHYANGDKAQMLSYYNEYEESDDNIVLFFSKNRTICPKAEARYTVILSFEQNLSYRILNLDIHRMDKSDSLYQSTIKKYVQDTL